jgi:hypothetical protein
MVKIILTVIKLASPGTGRRLLISCGQIRRHNKPVNIENCNKLFASHKNKDRFVFSFVENLEQEAISPTMRNMLDDKPIPFQFITNAVFGHNFLISQLMVCGDLQ